MLQQQIKLFIILGLLVSLSIQKNQPRNSQDFRPVQNKYGFYYLPIYESLNQNVWRKIKKTTTTSSPKIIDDDIAAALKAEPDAEMLPADYSGVASPGVDHMEMIEASDER